MTAHGFRSMGAGWASDHGFDFVTIERQLAHTLDPFKRRITAAS